MNINTSESVRGLVVALKKLGYTEFAASLADYYIGRVRLP